MCLELSYKYQEACADVFISIVFISIVKIAPVLKWGKCILFN